MVSPSGLLAATTTTSSAPIPSSPIGVVLVVIVLVVVSRPIIRWVADKEQNPWLIKVLTISLILHLVASPAQIYVVDHFYHGIADWIRYDQQGSLLAPNFRAFNFTLAGSNVHAIVNDGSVSIFTGVVMAIVGVNQLAAFLVFSWLSFVGTIFFYRAFTTTFPGPAVGHRRYAYLVFFLPSTIFWTADVSKEAIMTVSLGLVALGCAKVLVHAPGGFRLLTLGVLAGALIRPNELLVILGGFAVALMIRPQPVGPGRNTLKRLGGLVFMAALLGVSVFITLHYFKLGRGSGGSLSLSSTNRNNQGTGLGHGSSGLGYSSNPLRWPIDAYTVLFDPLPFNAHGAGEYAAALENTVILGVIIASYRQLRILPRTAFARPYVMMCLVYSIGFIYAFAALGNLGLIYRERVMLLPFLMVLLAIPRTPKGRPPMYEWEYKRKDRKQFRIAMVRRERMVHSMRRAYAASLQARSAAGAPGLAPTASAGGTMVETLEPGTREGPGPGGGAAEGEGGGTPPPP
ncbi:MAG: hypothetical protein ABSF84_12735 [Acidimicrobiales bacterium]|jgi:hypothetical protein